MASLPVRMFPGPPFDYPLPFSRFSGVLPQRPERLFPLLKSPRGCEPASVLLDHAIELASLASSRACPRSRFRASASNMWKQAICTREDARLQNLGWPPEPRGGREGCRDGECRRSVRSGGRERSKSHYRENTEKRRGWPPFPRTLLKGLTRSSRWAFRSVREIAVPGRNRRRIRQGFEDDISRIRPIQAAGSFRDGIIHDGIGQLGQRKKEVASPPRLQALAIISRRPCRVWQRGSCRSR